MEAHTTGEQATRNVREPIYSRLAPTAAAVASFPRCGWLSHSDRPTVLAVVAGVGRHVLAGRTSHSHFLTHFAGGRWTLILQHIV